MTVRIPPGYKLKVKDGNVTRLYSSLPTQIDETLPSQEPMHDDFKLIRSNYQKHYGDVDGLSLFNEWVINSELDTGKPYSLQHQLVSECVNGLCESWRWAKPYIELYRKDDGGTFYKVLALTGNVSMNKNDYSDLGELSQNASSLGHRMLNLNHDHNMRLSFPDNRVDISAFEDKGVETIIRVDNTATHPLHGKNINKMITDKDIIHVSIEGKPRAFTEINGVKKPIGYNLLELALLEKNVTLAGDPLTFLEPIKRGEI